MTSPSSVMAILLASMALLGCSSDEIECRNPQPGTLLIGVGDLDSGFIPASDDDPIQIVLGPQGLHMIVVSARALDFEQPDTAASIVRIGIEHEGTTIGGNISAVTPLSLSHGEVDFLGLRGVLNIDDVRALDGEPADVTISIEDGCGRALEDRCRFRLGL